MPTQSSDPTASMLLDLVSGHRVTAIIHAVAKLGIADLLFEGPRTARELSSSTQAHEPSLLRLMRALVALAICTEAPDGAFNLTEVGTYLAEKAERSMKAWVLLEGETLRSGWSELVESIRTGKTGGELAGLGKERFEVMATTKTAAVFNQAMVCMTRIEVPAILAAYDFAGISTLMDVGGGFAQLMSAILTRYPAMSGVVFDLPHLHRRRAEKSFRCHGKGGFSMTRVVPTGRYAVIEGVAA